MIENIFPRLQISGASYVDKTDSLTLRQKSTIYGQVLAQGREAIMYGQSLSALSITEPEDMAKLAFISYPSLLKQGTAQRNNYLKKFSQFSAEVPHSSIRIDCNV